MNKYHVISVLGLFLLSSASNDTDRALGAVVTGVGLTGVIQGI